jgi:hypothetical protein
MSDECAPRFVLLKATVRIAVCVAERSQADNRKNRSNRSARNNPRDADGFLKK